MAPDALKAHEYWKEYKKNRVNPHKDANKHEKP